MRVTENRGFRAVFENNIKISPIRLMQKSATKKVSYFLTFTR